MTGLAPNYLSAPSANALISDLRPTTLSPVALSHLNDLLDELLTSILTTAQSINPLDLRREGVPSVFSGEKTGGSESTGVRALGRSAVAEAEVELRSWHEGRTGAGGFPPAGKGTGTRSERSFPLAQAVDLLRLKCISFSTLAAQDVIDESLEEEVLSAWKKVGGDVSDNTVEPAGLWVTAILEHVCEHILSQLSRVVARDSSVTVASPQDLYTALCEDESVWGFFKRMKVKNSLETAIKEGSRSKRSTPARTSPGGRASPASLSNSPRASKVSLVSQRAISGSHPREGSLDGSKGISSSSIANEPRSSVEHSRFGNIARKGSVLSRKSVKNNALSHERSGSVLSDNTRTMIGAFNDSWGNDEEHQERAQSPLIAQDEFDKLMKSEDTVKVSLTPSRLKTFEPASGRRKPNDSPSHRASPTARGNQSTEDVHSYPANPRLVPDSPSHTEITDNTEIRSPPSTVSSPPLSVNGRVRSASSARKLLARGATTIEERSEEEDEIGLPAFLAPKKESLMELLASDDMFGPVDKTEKKRPLAEKRTVPAVVLGTPPPPPPAPKMQDPPQVSSSPSEGRTARQGSADSNADGSTRGTGGGGGAAAAAARSRRRTEAQELADFFNSAPPPAPPPAPSSAFGMEDEPPLTAKSARSFRSLMAKVTGTKKVKDEPLPPSTSHTRLNSIATENGFPDPTLQARRQKSFQSMSSVPSSTTYRHHGVTPDEMPPPPRSVSAPYNQNDSNNRHPSHSNGAVLRGNGGGDKAKLAAMLGDGAPSPAPIVLTLPPKQGEDRDRDTPRKGRIPVPALEDTERGKVSANVARRSSPEKLERLPAALNGSTTLVPSSTPPSSSSPARALPPAPVPEQIPSYKTSQLQEKYNNNTKSTPDSRGLPIVNYDEQSQQEGKSSLGPVLESLPLPPVRPSMSAPSPSETTSFATADEGEQQEQEQEVGCKDEGEKQETQPVSTETNRPLPATSAVPSIALEELVPLRHLLDHATTVRECRLLLSAILSQYGVPLGAESPGNSEGPLTPEDRVTAWLLAGRDGPVGDLPQIADMSIKDDEGVRGEVEAEGKDIITPREPLKSLGPPINLDTRRTTSSEAETDTRPISTVTETSTSDWSTEEEELLIDSDVPTSIEESHEDLSAAVHGESEGEGEDGEGRTTPRPSPKSSVRKERASVIMAHKIERISPKRYIAGSGEEIKV